MTKRFKLWLGAAGVIALASVLLVAVLLLALEGYLRYVIPPSSTDALFEYTLATPRYKVNRRSVTVLAHGVPLTTNSLGFRSDQADVPPKAPGEVRIVVLGDSFTVAAGVPFEQLYTTVLERRLREDRPEVRVMNLAVGGYNIIQYELVLKEVALDLAPDLVVVAVYPFNDFSNEDFDDNQRIAKGGELVSPWYHRSFVYLAYVSKIIHLLTRQAAPSLEATARQERERRQNLDALQAIVQTTASRHIPAIVAVLPTTSSVAQQTDVFGAVEKDCRERALPCLNLLDAFARSGANPRLMRVNLVDGHPDAAYQAVVADALAAHIKPIIGRR